VDEFRNCFLHENILETNPQFQAVELAIGRMLRSGARYLSRSSLIVYQVAHISILACPEERALHFNPFQTRV
jgi:hypothetical protein